MMNCYRRTLAALLLFVSTAARVNAEVNLRVQLDADRTDALVERRLDWSALGLQPPQVRVVENGVELPSQVESDRVAFRLPGLTKAGTRRRVSVVPGTPTSVTSDNLQVTTDGGVVRVNNGFCVVEHSPAKNGGLPSRITFKSTGRTEEGFVYNDRVYDHAAAQGFSLNQDKAPVVKLLSKGPLVAVVEVTARYLNGEGKAPASQPKAVYQFRYIAGSPVIKVEARIEQAQPFYWSELHFIEFNTKELNFTKWMIGQPDQNGSFVNAEKGAVGKWGAIYNDREAIGLQAGDARIYDGYKAYGNYLHGDWVTWGETAHSFRGMMYVGDADEGLASLRRSLDEATVGMTAGLSSPDVDKRISDLSKRLTKTRSGSDVLARWHLAQARNSLVTSSSLNPAREELSQVEKILISGTGAAAGVVVESTDKTLCAANGEFAIALQRYGDTVALRSLYDVGSDREFVRETDSPQGLWQLAFIPPDFAVSKTARLNPSNAPCKWRTQKTASGVDLLLQWRDLALSDEAKAVDVEATISVPNKGTLTEWRIRVTNRSKLTGLQSVSFPRITNLTVSRSGALAAPQGWGQLYRDATRTGQYHGDYPNGWCTMQFASVFDGGSGVYLAAHDGKAIHKCFTFVPHPESQTLSFELAQIPEAIGSPGKGYESSYPAVVGTHTGDWFDAAKIYRSWAMNHSVWFPKQPLSKNTDTPDWLKQNPLWCCTGGDPKDVVPKVTKFREFFGVPMGFHWYSWHQIPFDDHYPEYFPAKVGFKEGVAELKSKDVRVMPYINGRLFDSQTDSWKNESAQNYCALNDKGEKYVEVYGKSPPLSPMCPATEYWQEKISGIVERLVGEFGVSGVYIDQIGAAGVAPCYNRNHSHSAGGAASWVPGYRELLTRTRKKMRAEDPESFLTTEDAAEPYQGEIDAFLMCNQTRANLIPMYSAVYGGRTLTFGRYIFETDAKASLPFITKVAEMFVFGAQLGWIDPFILKYPREAGYLKSLAETRLAATKYLALGEMLRPPVIEYDAPPVKTSWELWGNPYPVEYPAVMGSVWRADDGTVGLVVTNLTEQNLKFRWQCEGKRGDTEIEGLSARVVGVR